MRDAVGMHDDRERCLRAVQSRDARFDGWFYMAVVTTGIYCRPSCPARTPKPQNVRFFPSSAAAQQAGFRACKRCRPDASPGSPEWNTREDVVARAMRLIRDGVVDREGVGGLASRLGYSTRQLERHVRAELGAGPLAVARAQRAQTARLLIETTTVPMSDAAFASGFSSVRSFNATVQEVFAAAPTELRMRGIRGVVAGPRGSVVLRLPFRRPLCPDNLFGHLAATAVPGVEEWRDGWYRRTMRLPVGVGAVELRPAPDHVVCRLTLEDMRDLATAIARCRWLLDLDADPVAIDTQLSLDPLLEPLVAAAPGRRVPRTVDADELAVRAVLGQQVSTAAARTHAARLVAACGDPFDDAAGGLTHVFPAATTLAEMDVTALALPASRRQTFTTLVAALASGDIDVGPGAPWDVARSSLLAIPGIGPWTAEIIAMRGLGDPDAFLAADLGVVAAAKRLGIPSSPRALTECAAGWRPWRAYAVQHLWATGPHAVNQIPGDATS